MESIDLNELLAQRLVSGDIRQLLTCTLDPTRTLLLIHKKKQYSLLESLSQKVNFDAVHCDTLHEVYADMIRDKDEEAIKTLCRVCEYDAEELSFLCGEKGYEADVLGCDFSLRCYVMGIISVDNLDLFLATKVKYAQQWQGNAITEHDCERDVRELASNYFAPKILDHLGYDGESMILYLNNIACLDNKALLHHLWTKENVAHRLYGVLSIKAPEYRLHILQWVLKQGCHLDEITWLAIQRQMPELYEACAQDV